MNNIKNTQEQYKKLFLEPKSCDPLIIVDYPIKPLYSWGEMVRDKEKMLATQVEAVEKRLKLGDDYLPTLRINFGTGQIAAAFGCELAVLEDNLPACKTHILKDINLQDEQLLKPGMQSYWNEKLLEFQQYFMAQKPQEYPLQHPDVQSAFNTAHLIRGNDLFLDMFDEPERVKELLFKVNEFMKVWLYETKRGITKAQEGWFYDACGYWKGGARISNCSMQMISPEMYRQFVQEFDSDLMDYLGAGRIHYCGEHPDVIKDFDDNKNISSIEIDLQFHKINDICDVVRDTTVIKFCDWSVDGAVTDWQEDFLSRGMPQKRNFVISAKADSEQEAKQKLYMLKEFVQKGG